jgi:hypothetical protein
MDRIEKLIIELIKKYMGRTIINGVGTHAKKHSIQSILDHTSTATPGQFLKADAAGLPVDSGFFLDLTEPNERLQLKYKAPSNTTYNILLEDPNEV